VIVIIDIIILLCADIVYSILSSNIIIDVLNDYSLFKLTVLTMVLLFIVLLVFYWPVLFFKLWRNIQWRIIPVLLLFIYSVFEYIRIQPHSESLQRYCQVWRWLIPTIHSDSIDVFGVFSIHSWRHWLTTDIPSDIDDDCQSCQSWLVPFNSLFIDYSIVSVMMKVFIDIHWYSLLMTDEEKNQYRLFYSLFDDRQILRVCYYHSGGIDVPLVFHSIKNVIIHCRWRNDDRLSGMTMMWAWILMNIRQSVFNDVINPVGIDILQYVFIQYY